MIIALIMPEMFSLYNFIIKSNKEIIARQQAIQQWYEFFERLNILMEDYTIDYEEYYNRQMVWCSDGEEDFGRWRDFKRNVGLQWYCTNFTAYGNENSSLKGNYMKYNDIYYCTSLSNKQTIGNENNSKIVYMDICGSASAYNAGGSTNNYKQSYGQYANLFTDVKWGIWTIIWSEDDEELWYLINTTSVNNKTIDAIENSDNIQELYLISHDWDRRMYFRRKLINPNDNTPEKDKKYKQYQIQMLRLRGFDAWRMHNFEILETANGVKNKWLYDGIIDTWACDTSMWFEPAEWHKTHSVWWAYSDYYLPQDVDDCWVDLTHWTTDLFSWKISISPRWDSDLYWAKQNRQINPYMKIMIINKIYLPAIIWSNMRIANTINEFDVPLETTINMKDFYRTNY